MTVSWKLKLGSVVSFQVLGKKPTACHLPSNRTPHRSHIRVTKNVLSAHIRSRNGIWIATGDANDNWSTIAKLCNDDNDGKRLLSFHLCKFLPRVALVTNINTWVSVSRRFPKHPSDKKMLLKLATFCFPLVLHNKNNSNFFFRLNLQLVTFLSKGHSPGRTASM